MHGGASGTGGPPGKRSGQYRHGERTKAAIAERRKFSALLKMLRAGQTGTLPPSTNPKHHVEVLTSVVYRHRRVAAMTVLIEPFASVYYDRSCLGVIFARGRNGFEAYAADDHSLGLFPSPRKAAAAITTTRPWIAERSA